MRTRRKIPGERSCMGCGRKTHKRALLRFVRTEDGTLRYDPAQRASGRGGYLCPREACLALAVRKRRLSNRFRGEVREDLDSLLQHLNRPMHPDRNGGGGTQDAADRAEDAQRPLNRNTDPAPARSCSDE